MTRRREKAAQPVGTRRAAREFAFRTLFEAERGGGGVPLDAVFMRAEGSMRDGDDTFPRLREDAVTFARQLLGGLQAHRADIDGLLQRTIRGWSFEQMAQTDLNILRLAAYEMKYTAEPHPPVIESAVRIARKFGGDDSGRFVNGVLASVSRALQTAPAAPPSGAELPEAESVETESPETESLESGG